jgi:hypothetical protein
MARHRIVTEFLSGVCQLREDYQQPVSPTLLDTTKTEALESQLDLCRKCPWMECPIKAMTDCSRRARFANGVWKCPHPT